MKRFLSLAAIAIVALLMSACGGGTETPEPTATLEPTPEPTQPVERGQLTIEDDKLYVAIIWHQHQPVYFKDPETGIYEKPWVRVHAAKDYVDMASMLLDYPLIHATFNLTPSLIRQLDDIGAGAKDLYWTHTEIRAEELTQEQKQFILDRFFDINPSIIARFPRYQELSQMRTAEAVDTWTIQDFRDLQVLFNLAWMDPAWLEEEPLASVVAKERDFDGGDKVNVLAAHLRLVNEVIPLHADMQRDGQIEVTMTPFAHPILPLLVDSDLASIALPDADLPTRFVYGQDAVSQVKLGVEFYQDHFGQLPRGMWPAEGSVAEQALSMIASEGIQWIATDEDVLAGSLDEVVDFTRDSDDVVQQADALYRPYAVEGARGGPFAIIFRDHLISDKVGFEYSGMPGEAAAADFVARLEAIKDQLQEEGGEGPHLVTVLLDGENAWEYYENDGKEFLHEMYRLLSESEDLVTVTPAEYLDALDEQGVELPQIETLWAGSWIDGTFSTWIGEEEENTAWEYLRQAREAVQEASSSLDEETLEQVMDLIYIAEGSDWFWWYGADQNSGSDDSFDRQFRGYLEQIYTTLEIDVPDYVHVPIIPQAAQSPDRESGGLLSVTADGIVGEGEWDDAAFYTVKDKLITGVYYGFDQRNLFLRVDTEGQFGENLVLGIYLGAPGSGATNAYSRNGETLLGYGVKRLIEVTYEGGVPQGNVYEADGAGGWSLADPSMRNLEGIASGDELLEMVVPFDQVLPGARSGDQINVRVVLGEGASDVAVIPDSGPALATVPDLPIANVFLELSDPPNDDNGPGTYQYPGDAVFKTGVFDIIGLTVGFDDEDYIFRVQFRGPVLNEWDSPNGLSIQTIDVYVDHDGPGSGERMLLPGRNAALTPEFAWDVAIWAEGWTPGIFVPSDEGPVETATQLSVITNPGQRRVTMRVPKSALPGDPTGWKVALVVMSQEGYPSSGVWRVRDVMPVAEQWRIGGGTGSRADTRILDLLWPKGDQPSQAELLGHENPVDVDLASLGPDELPQVPMVGP